MDDTPADLQENSGNPVPVQLTHVPTCRPKRRLARGPLPEVPGCGPPGGRCAGQARALKTGLRTRLDRRSHAHDGLVVSLAGFKENCGVRAPVPRESSPAIRRSCDDPRRAATRRLT